MSADLDQAVRALEDAVDNAAAVDATALQRLLAAVVRLYAARVEVDGELRPLAAGARWPTPTATETLVTVGDLLDAADLEVFELGLWKTMGGVRP